MRCAVIAVFADKVNNYFLLFLRGTGNHWFSQFFVSIGLHSWVCSLPSPGIVPQSSQKFWKSFIRRITQSPNNRLIESICVNRDEGKARKNHDVADITDWGAHAARVHVSAASLKQSVFHHEDTKNDKIIESGKQVARFAVERTKERVDGGFETRSAPALTRSPRRPFA